MFELPDQQHKSGLPELGALGPYLTFLASVFAGGFWVGSQFTGESARQPIFVIVGLFVVLLAILATYWLARRHRRLKLVANNALGIWLKDIKGNARRVVSAPTKIPIITIANLKGGVAKTMLSANLAAYFARRGEYPLTTDFKSLKVLLLDMDYQGSLTRLMRNDLISGEELTDRNHVEKFFDNSTTYNELAHLGFSNFEHFRNIRFFSCAYGFDDLEVLKQFEWLQGNSRKDVRFILREALIQEEIADSYDMVIIDTGPRLTLGAINALAASTHVLIPTATDARSLQATQTFLNRLATMKFGTSYDGNITPICPRLAVAGIIPTLLKNGQSYRTRFSEEATKIEEELRTDPHIQRVLPKSQLFFQNIFYRNDALAASANQSIPFLQGEYRKVFNTIGKELEERIKHED